MKSISTGVGLALLAGSIALHPVLSKAILEPSGAEAAAPTALAPMAMAQAEPTVIWMGMSTIGGLMLLTRLWSDGTLEARSVGPTSSYNGYCYVLTGFCSPQNWIEIPPPPAGNGFACRSDVNGDRRVDGADLASLLGNWGDNMSCDPEPTYPCLDLSLAGGGALR